MNIDKKQLCDPYPIEYINQILPGWIQCVLDTYSNDYMYLTTNWKRLCNDFGTTMKNIIIVNDIPNGVSRKQLSIEDKNKIVVLDILTRNGWVIRRNNEFMECNQCKKSAILSKSLWKLLVNKPMFKSKIPKTYRNVCLKCYSSSNIK